MRSRKGLASPVILAAGDIVCVECENGLVVGIWRPLVVNCDRGEMRDVAKPEVREMGREEGFITLGKKEVKRVFRTDMASFKQKARSKEVKKAAREMCIL